MRGNSAGHNAPDLVVPPEEDQAEAAPAAAAEGEGGGFWGEEAPAEAAPAAPSDTAAEGSGDFWGDEGGDSAAAATAAASGYSDAVAIQLPAALPTGNRKPYFIFGDAQNAVDIWFQDLASPAARRYTGAGSAAVTAVEGEDVTSAAKYDHGEWSVILKRALRASGSVSFAEGQYVPVAFSVWDGASNERGNKRGLTQWMYLYTLPQVAPSPVGPMLRAALVVAALEIALVWWLRRRNRMTSAASAAPAS